MKYGFWRMGALGMALSASVACGGGHAPSIRATLVVNGVDLTCSSLEPGATCTITSKLGLTVQEDAGHDVHLALISTVVRDNRSMQDVHATPAQLSSDDIVRAAGSAMVAGHGQLSVPLVLNFSVQRPYIIGTLEPSVHVQGLDDDGNVVEADCTASYVVPLP
jgi:hypothetical protein